MTPIEDAPATIAFEALEYRADDAFQPARYVFREDPAGQWQVERDGRSHLALGRGYRLLRSRVCGVCSTDLDRRFLPFPLPQITGHEVVAQDRTGRRFVVEINASHAARGEAPCAFCRAGLETHCPSRLVLGIHDLPGGFGAWLLAPQHALVPVPDSVPDSTAALIEPFAAALRAVTTIDPPSGSRIAVLGPRRLGMLVVAALAAHRRRAERDFEIVAIARRPELRARALALGADTAEPPPEDANRASPVADVVIDTTGTPDGLALACTLATREVHLKSTHGQRALGCAHLTEAVVDEIAICGVAHADGAALRAALGPVERRCAGERLRVGWLCADTPPSTTTGDEIEFVPAKDAASLLEALERDDGRGSTHDHGAEKTLPRVDALVIDDASAIDAALRPEPGREVSPLRPRGELVVRVARETTRDERAIARVLRAGLRISTSRCGDFRAALELVESDASLRSLGDALVTHRFGADALRVAFDTARSAEAIKVLVDHAPQANLPPG